MASELPLCRHCRAPSSRRTKNNLGFNVGGGVTFLLSKRVGLQSDLRYVRAFVDENKREGVVFRDYGFLRVSFGVTFRFPAH